MSLPNGTWHYSGSVTFGVWAKKAGVWQKIGTTTQVIYQDFPTGGVRTITFNKTVSINLGPGVQAFGLTYESSTGTSGALTDFTSASWATTATSGERTATPNGQLSTIRVEPQ